MNKGIKIGALIILLILLLGGTYYLYINGYINYVIITATLSIICTLVLINTIIVNRSEDSIYRSKLKQILRTYDSILVKGKNLPKLDEKNIITVDTIEDMVDAQMEIRKPIYFQEHDKSCSFVLLDNTEACIFILKINDKVVDPLEEIINNLNKINNEQEPKESNMLNNVEFTSNDLLNDINDTTIVKVNKEKYLLVSPYDKQNINDKNNTDSNINDLVESKDKQVQEIEENTRNNDEIDNVKDDISQANKVEELADDNDIEELSNTDTDLKKDENIETLDF